jgi:hypothetical protein
MQDRGIEGMVNTSLWCERVAGTETISIGHSAFSRNECEMELAGRSLSYWLSLRGGFLFVSIREMDNASADPDVFFSLGDTAASWADTRRFIAALERSGIKSLQPRPLHVGSETGEGSFTIG